MKEKEKRQAERMKELEQDIEAKNTLVSSDRLPQSEVTDYSWASCDVTWWGKDKIIYCPVYYYTVQLRLFKISRLNSIKHHSQG
jgi:hypothetical protein